MTAKEFLEGKTLSSIDVVNNQIINLVIDETIIGLDVDTSNILFGTLLSNTNDFSYDGDILIYNGNSFDLTSINVLGYNNQNDDQLIDILPEA
jgi:hypothetical protein